MSEYEPDVVHFASATVVFGIERVWVIEPTLGNKFRTYAYRTRDAYVKRESRTFAGYSHSFTGAVQQGMKYVAQDWEADNAAE